MKSKIKKLSAAVLFISIILTGCLKGGDVVKYENGLRAVLLHNEDSLVSSINVFINVGSVNETPSQAGLSHFIEHLMFKGSKNYQGDLFSRNVENMGGYINAATSKEYTVYYVNIQKNGVEESIKMLADAMENPMFPQDEIDRERKVVIEEIQRHLDNPMSMLYEKFFETIYLQSELKNSVIGTAEVIGNISRDEIYSYYSSHYIPQKMTVVISGNFDKQKVRKLLDETFKNFQSKEIPPVPNLIEPPSKGRNIVLKENVEVSYLIGGFLGPVIDSDDIFAADLAMAVLGGGKSSRLNRVLKEEKRLVYSISSSFYTLKGTGVFFISAVFDEKNLQSIKEEIHKQIKDIIDNGITKEELDRAKVISKTDWAFGHETPSEIAQNVGYWTLVGRPEVAKNYLERIASLNVDDIKEVLRKYYVEDNYSSVALTPKGQK
jgi:zinc protease